MKAAADFAARAVASFYALPNEVLAEMKVLMQKLPSALGDAIAKAGQVLGDSDDAVVEEAKEVWNAIANLAWSSGAPGYTRDHHLRVGHAKAILDALSLIAIGATISGAWHRYRTVERAR